MYTHFLNICSMICVIFLCKVISQHEVSIGTSLQFVL
uniref:Uncharacterized protein n=1 Tax=Anguilla anguilla TaxID=7936 RepID=A0A0E9XNL4_ANGAN